jgi:ABC-2 type transport system ATP-binding protein
MNNVICVENVLKRYGKRAVLDGLCLDVPEGAVVGLLGKNGSGKTTLLKCLMGLLRTDRGTVRVLGEEAWTLSDAAKARIGYVAQGWRPYPWLSAGQLIDYTASFYPRWNTSLADKLAVDWQIDLTARVGVLSEGELQKLLIVLALGHEPELLILDEPVASLDPAARRQFLRMILEIVRQRRCTILFSSHITFDLERAADRVALLKGGRIDFFGGLDDLKDAVKRVRVRGVAPLPRVFSMNGIMSSHIDGQDAVLTIRGFNEIKRLALEKAAGAPVEVEDLNLEEIFLETIR